MYHVQAPDNVSPVRKTEFIPYQQEHYSPSKSANRARSKGSLTNSVRSSSGDTEDSSHDDDHAKHNKKRKMQSSKSIDDEEKRKNFLERNRQAALKCRQRKKQWLLNLQSKVEYLTNDNEQLQLQANAMREELMGLRSLLYAHKDCQHVNKQAVFDAIHRPVAGMPPMAPNPINMYPQPLLPTHPTAPGSTMAIPQQLGRAPLQRLS
ncbi:uncharacterized protein BYT42DRAFT_580583 [Radiomyces spectabilis]|uniref:uncharacterized protein n=1 Tax=Radiomyces spectabilis TaxID=64574 RepID=UPI00221E9A30|nr:uncharacterized protein BYT42DRAFT_580583 [Radiomyces spectabilis]KAI8371528.1 hypothetical protein BYT42DRAFT_580583 [Radiomyces spectabilis]